MRFLLDSAFVIDHLAGLPEAVDRFRALFEAGDDPLINEIVVCEVRAGLRQAHMPSFHTFLEPVEFVQPGPSDAILAGAWRELARQRGRHLSLADALIASAAQAADAAVLTRDIRDFSLTPVRVETY